MQSHSTTPLVSIHAPLARSNKFLTRSIWSRICFNTCSSCEEQQKHLRCRRHRHCFNTCSSCEEQRPHPMSQCTECAFQYMLLLRGATALRDNQSPQSEVSIHAPLARSNSAQLEAFRKRFVSIHAPLARSNFNINMIEMEV